MVTDVASHQALINAYLSGFDGGHLWFAPNSNFQQTFNWSGFKVGYLNGDLVVLLNSRFLKDFYAEKIPNFPTWPEENLPNIGEVLISCDGIPAAKMVAQSKNILRESSQIKDLGTMLFESRELFYDYDNPLLPRARSCIFSDGRNERAVNLKWQALDPVIFGLVFLNFNKGHANEPMSVQTYGKRGVWLNMPSFSFTDKSNTQFAKVVTDLKAVKNPSVIVFDLRGNTGGTTHYFKKIFSAAFGQKIADKTAACVDEGYEIYRRASLGNLAAVKKAASEDTVKRPEETYFQRMVTEFEKARLEGKEYAGASPDSINQPEKEWSRTNDLSKGNCNISEKDLKQLPKIVVLFDFYCFSACSMFVDQVAQIKSAIFLGQPMQEKDYYLEILGQPVPSGLGDLIYPMMYQRNPNHRQVYHPRYWIKLTELPIPMMQTKITEILTSEFKMNDF